MVDRLEISYHLSVSFKLKKIICLVLFLQLITVPSHAAKKTVEIENFAKLQFSNVITLGKSNCQTVRIDYEIDPSLDVKDAAMVIQIAQAKKKKIFGGVAWWGDLTSQGTDMTMPLIGRLNLKICKTAWNFKTQKYSGIGVGTYDFYIAYGKYLPDGGIDKQELFEKIQFKK
jgi:hypothetical protein